MVKQMKNNENKLSSLPDRDERLGEVLANGLKEMGIDGCPGAEEIAALLDGSVTVGGEKREKMMKHLASCADCHEIFLLTSNLQEEEEGKKVTEIKKKRIDLISFKPLALAASLLIVIFSIYLFYKNDEIPKSSEQFFEMSKAKEERGVPLEEPKRKADLPPAPSADKQLGLKAARPSAPKKKAYRRDGPLGKIKKKGGDVSQREEEEKAEVKTISKAAGIRAVEETVTDEARDMKLARTRPTGVKNKTTQLPRSQKRDYSQQVVGGAKSQLHMQAKAATAFNEANLWRGVKALELRGRSYKTNMPGQELQTLFKDTLRLTKQWQKTFRDAGKEAKESDDFRWLAPLITLVTVGDADYVFPNIDYFLEKSGPGSLEYRFFKLARSGWCDAEGFCYGAGGNIPGGKDMETGKKLLGQWEALKPQLKGIFRQIAGHTVNRLKQDSR